MRAELSVKLDLSDRQLQMWFCHRRVKDRKVSPMINKAAAPSLAPMGEEGVEQIAVADDVMHDSGLVSILRPIGHVDAQRVVTQYGVMESSSYHEAHQTLQELRAVALVERQLGETLREDGPILGMEFDSLPPGAFGAPLGKLGFLITIVFL